MLLGALLLSIALATPADDLARGFRVDDTEGWVAGEWDGGHGLVRGSDGLALPLSFKRAGEEPAEQLSVGDIGRERAALVVELAARKLRVVDLKGRVVTTPLGEPMVLVEYVIEAAKGFEGEAPNHGARVTRRCGPTVRVTWEGAEVVSQRVLDASRQVIWAEADCERFNPRTFHQTVTVAASGPPPRDLPPPHPPKMGPSRLEIGVAVGLILAVVAAFFGFRRGSPSPKAASPSPKPPPRRAPPPEELLLPPSPSPSPSMSLSSKALPSMSPPGAPAGLRKPEPRALGAMGAAEGVWVVPSLPALPQPPPPPPPAAPPPQPPMLAWGAPSTVEAEPAPAPQPLEAPGPSLLHWLHSSNDEDLPQPVAETEAERDAADAEMDGPARGPDVLAPSLSLLMPGGPPLPAPSRPPAPSPLPPAPPPKPAPKADYALDPRGWESEDGVSPETLVPQATIAHGPDFPDPLPAAAESENVKQFKFQGSKDDPLLRALRQLGALVGMDRSPPPHSPLPELPAGYRVFLELHDGVSLGGGWLRLFGAWEGRPPTVQQMNMALAGRFGRRTLVGCFANGLVVLLNVRGEVVLAKPGVSARQAAPNLTLFLANLAADPPLREDLCDKAELLSWSRQAGPLGPDQVYYGEGEALRRVSLVDLWLRAPSLL